jgi:arginyl-tRNA synthetase
MWADLKQRLADSISAAILERFGVEHAPVVEVPPRRELGDLSCPAGMQLARVLKRNPRAIAEELAAAVRLPERIREVRVEGAGFLNFFLDRPAFAAALLESAIIPAPERSGKVIIEHTNINPNKAAHIGHLRNAVLGDILGRILRGLGYEVEIQNYIDDTGVQLADVVVGFLDLRSLTRDEIAALPEPFDFYCWDLYGEVGHWYEGDPTRQALRRQTLHQLESGEGPRADVGRLIARRIVARHLLTMSRLGIGYDLLTHESDILGLHFFDQAFGLLKESGAIHLEADGKNQGCWVMPLSQAEEFAGLEDPDKVIVRSDGTVTYVGKDIAYQLWKFGLLGADFGYAFWEAQGIWETTRERVPGHPPFGNGHRVFNVIDARQSYLQKIVKAGLQALGHHDEAERSTHFSYEMVALSPATARQLGFLEAGGDEEKVLEMSGRKGIGVKADDLLDQLAVRAREEILARNRELPHEELDTLARLIATAALRFFMIKATNNRVIAFDFDEALSFEGDSGPYLQYSLVRARRIHSRLEAAGLPSRLDPAEAAALPAALWTDDLWSLVVEAAQSGEVAEKASATLELSLLARHTLELAQAFNTLYRAHPILQEADPELRGVRLAMLQVFCRTLEALAALLGIPIPERM